MSQGGKNRTYSTSWFQKVYNCMDGSSKDRISLTKLSLTAKFRVTCFTMYKLQGLRVCQTHLEG